MIEEDDYSKKEYEILEETAERKGWEWLEKLEIHILAQAELVYGEL